MAGIFGVLRCPKEENMGEMCHHSWGATWTDDVISEVTYQRLRNITAPQ